MSLKKFGSSSRTVSYSDKIDDIATTTYDLRYLRYNIASLIALVEFVADYSGFGFTQNASSVVPAEFGDL